MWYSNGMFHYMLKAEFVTLASLKVPSGLSYSEHLCFFSLTRTVSRRKMSWFVVVFPLLAGRGEGGRIEKLHLEFFFFLPTYFFFSSEGAAIIAHKLLIIHPPPLAKTEADVSLSLLHSSYVLDKTSFLSLGKTPLDRIARPAKCKKARKKCPKMHT